MSVRRCGIGVVAVGWLLVSGWSLAASGVANAQGGGASGVGLVPIVPVPPANGGGGGASAGAPATMGCDAFMQCPEAQQGRGVLIDFEVSLASGIDARTIDELRISMVIVGEPVSWSPWVFKPETGLGFPLSTSFIQTCADEYGESVATLEAFADGQLVARAAGMLTTHDCMELMQSVVLQPVAQTPAATAGTGGAARPGGGGGASPAANSGAGSGASAAGQSGSTGSSSGASGADSAKAPADDGGCGCSTVGAARTPAGLAFSGLVLAVAAARTRRARRSRVNR